MAWEENPRICLHMQLIAILSRIGVTKYKASPGHYARRNQQEMCPRQSVVHSCFPCSNPWLAWASKRQCPREALFIVVKVVQVVFLSCPGEALHQLLSICPGEALLVSSRSALTILHTTRGGCARMEAKMCIIVKTIGF